MLNKKSEFIFPCFLLIILAGLTAACVSPPSDSGQTGSLPSVASSTTADNTISERSTAAFAAPIAPDESPEPVRDLSGHSGDTSADNLRKTWQSHTPIFQTSFSPGYSSEGIRVDVKKGPLLVNYQVSPRNYDPRISFFVITIRDLENNRIVAQDGYGEPFTSTPEKQIIVYGEGPYHVNLYGNQVDVNVAVYTGDA
jgi:hypothetical protein